MNTRTGIILLVMAAMAASGTAVAHLSCVFLGPACYTIQMAPPVIIESAEQGLLLAPVATIIVSTIFLLFAAYALSAARLIILLPLTKLAVYSIGTVCIIRGLLPIQLWLRHPQKVTDMILVVGVVWLLVGLCYVFGYFAVNRSKSDS